MKRRLTTTAFALAVIGTPALAHLNPAEHGSLLAGLSHPLSGADHLLAMVAVGLWAGQIGGKAKWIIPASFVATMVIGFALATIGAKLPFIEPAILASVIGLGILIALAVRLPLMISACTVAAFALFHGFAHGTEVGTAGVYEFGFGFVTATVLLHLAGVLFGALVSKQNQAIARLLGMMTAIGGLALVYS